MNIEQRIEKLPTDITVERLRGQVESLCDLCEIDLKMTRKRPNGKGLYVHATNGKRAYVEIGSDHYTLKRMILELGYPIPFLIKHEYENGEPTGITSRIDLV